MERLKELTQILNEASKAYYQKANEIMSNFEYDKLYDELVEREKKLGITLSNSPTVNVGYEVVSELPKERHARPMLSLDKTKDVEGLREFIGSHDSVISWKMDGLTIVLTYRDGELQKAVTRGNGEVGEVITANAKAFKNIPLKIAYKGELVLRGEAVIGYKDFEKINEEIPEVESRYKNPRNLCSGSVRQLNSKITASRNVQFYAFSLVQAEGVDFKNSRAYQLDWLKEQGFEVVEHYIVTRETLDDKIKYFSEKIVDNDFPSDGLVLTYDDIAYGQSLGRTSKFPRDAFAFKWADEIKETTLLEIEWSPSRTGLINPVAIFEPVELEGTTVSRASVHNISIMEELELGVGDKIEVYKANMIIPQIAENKTRSGVKDIPTVCPVCAGETKILQEGNAKALYCMNPECQAKKIKSYALFVSRDALNIEGLSEATIEKFVAQGIIKDYVDFFHLEDHKETIESLDGFGEKSFAKLVASANKAKETTLAKVIYSLGIANIGLANAKMICKETKRNKDNIMDVTEEELSAVQGVGDVIAKAYVDYFKNPLHRESLEKLLKEVKIQEETVTEEQIFEGKTFVITGSLEKFANRGEMKELIEQRGGKVTGSVTKKTSYLINNNVESSSSKNKKAKELEIPIITEEEFMNMLN